MVRRVTSSIFVGRVVERARLEAGLDGAGQGEPGFVLIGGEAGIGKSRLVGELEAMAKARNFLTTRGACVEAADGGLPWAPFIEILRLLQKEASEGVAPLIDVLRRDISRMTVPLADSASDRSSTETPLSLYHAIDELIDAVSGDRPLVVMIEDLHWADPSSRQLLRFLAARLGSKQLLVTATFRSDDLTRTHPLRGFLAETVRLEGVERMDLLPLGRSEVEDQITGILGEPPQRSLADLVADRADGNPFFVEELIAAGGAENGGPSRTLQEVVTGRIAALSDDAQTIIRVAAAFGRDFDDVLLARVARLPADRLHTGLREAVDHHVLIPIDRSLTATFRFRHALVQEFAYGDLLPPERVALHAAIAHTLHVSDGSNAAIAHHAYRAHDLPMALARSVDAAREAVGTLAFADALEHLERSLELWSAVRDAEARTGCRRSAVLLLASRSAAACGRPERARDLARQALVELDPAADRDARIAVLLDLYFLEAHAGDPAGRDQATNEAEKLIPETPPTAARARVLVNLAGMHQMAGRPEDAERLALEARDLARAAGAPEAEAEALMRLADLVGATFGQAVTAVEYLNHAAAIAAEYPEASHRFMGRLLWLRAWRQSLAGDFQDSLHTADEAMAWAARAGVLGQWVDAIREVRISVLADVGGWEAADALVDEARRAGPLAYRRIIDSYRPIQIRRGNLAQAAEGLNAQAFGALEGSADPAMETLSAILVANAEERWVDARAAADTFLAALPNPLHDAGAWFVLSAAIEGEADHAETARHRRRADDAAVARQVGSERVELLERSLRAAIVLGGAGSRAEALLTMAQAEGGRLEGRFDPAMWEEAATRLYRLGQQWDGAYAGYRHAQALLGSRGSKAAATDILRECNRVAVELGAAPLQGKIELLAVRARIGLDVATTIAPPAQHAITDEGVVVRLTGRERQVLALVAAGHTNREIGTQLFISAKTASVHITNAMDKLGALSRYDAAAQASRLGLLGNEHRAADQPMPASN